LHNALSGRKSGHLLSNASGKVQAREVITLASMNARRIHGSNTSITILRNVARSQTTSSVGTLSDQSHQDTGEYTIRFTAMQVLKRLEKLSTFILR
jgi:hypothetical protein